MDLLIKWDSLCPTPELIARAEEELARLPSAIGGKDQSSGADVQAVATA